jgi:hypothetical protein
VLATLLVAQSGASITAGLWTFGIGSVIGAGISDAVYLSKLKDTEEKLV